MFDAEGWNPTVCSEGLCGPPGRDGRVEPRPGPGGEDGEGVLPEVADDKSAEFESLVRDVGIPVEMGRAAAGKTQGYDVLRAVVPRGSGRPVRLPRPCSASGCSRRRFPPTGLDEDLKRAGLATTAQQVLQRWRALKRPRQPGVVVVRRARRPRLAEGQLRDHQLLEDAVRWVRGLPRGRAAVLETHRRGAPRSRGRRSLGTWSGFGALPKADGYQGLTINTDHDWATMVQRLAFPGRGQDQVFPGLTFAQAEAHKQSVRTQSHTEIFRLVVTTTN